MHTLPRAMLPAVLPFLLFPLAGCNTDSGDRPPPAPGGATGPVTYNGLGVQEAGAILLFGLSQSGTPDNIRGLFLELSPES